MLYNSRKILFPSVSFTLTYMICSVFFSIVLDHICFCCRWLLLALFHSLYRCEHGPCLASSFTKRAYVLYFFGTHKQTTHTHSLRIHKTTDNRLLYGYMRHNTWMCITMLRFTVRSRYVQHTQYSIVSTRFFIASFTVFLIAPVIFSNLFVKQRCKHPQLAQRN